jgi:hypothetical protein
MRSFLAKLGMCALLLVSVLMVGTTAWHFAAEAFGFLSPWEWFTYPRGFPSPWRLPWLSPWPACS